MKGDERSGKLAELPDALRPEERVCEEPSSPTTTSGAPDAPEIFRVSARMYLRTIFLMAWSAFRHPFRTTYIDMASGEFVHIRPGEETWSES